MTVPPDIASAPGECARHIQEKDWSTTALGPCSDWPPALRTTVSTMLRSPQPMVVLWGPESICLYNDAYMPSFGAQRHPNAMGTPAREAWPENWHLVQEHVANVMNGAPSPVFDNRMVPVWRRGRLEQVYWSYSYVPVPIADGSIGGCIVLCQETTSTVLSQRRVRLALAADDALFHCSTSEELFATFVRVIQSRDLRAAFLFDTHGQLRASGTAGPTSCAALLDALAQRSATGTLTPGVHRFPECAVALAEWPTPADTVYVTPFGHAGTKGHLAVVVHPGLSFDSRYRRHIDQLVNLLLHHQARIDRDTVRATVEHERDQLFEQAPIPVAILTGPDHLYTLANQRYLNLLRTAKAVVGMRFLDVFPYLRDHPIHHALRAAYTQGTPYVEPELHFALRGEDGSTTDAYFSIALQPLRSDIGDVTGVMLVADNVTEEVEARIKLHRSDEERARLIEKLEAASRAKDEFLAMLGHELRNPLSPILTAVELLKLRGAKGIDTELGIIERQLAQMVGLVDDLLDIARVTRGAVELHRSRILVDDLCKRAIEQASPLIGSRRHTLDVDIEPGLWLEGDARRLAQVLGNLLNNAAKYTPPGGALTVRGRTEGASVTLQVSDTGIGVDATKVGLLFSPFVREDRDASTGGLGLGLAIVQSLVDAHSGTVLLESDGHGKGTTVTVRLPQVSPLPRPTPPMISSYPPGSEALRVLIVDDNKDAADLLATALRLKGHTVQVRYSPESALASADTFVPHVGLFDLGMPVMDGYELHRRMSRLETWAKVRFIAITGYGQEADRDRTLAAGFSCHLVKPVDLEELDRQLDKLRPPGPA